MALNAHAQPTAGMLKITEHWALLRPAIKRWTLSDKRWVLALDFLAFNRWSIIGGAQCEWALSLP